MENYVKMLRAPGAEWIQEACKRLYEANHFKGKAHIHEQPYKEMSWYEPSIEDYLGMVDWDSIGCDVIGLRFHHIGRWAYKHLDYTFYFKTEPELILAFVQHKVKRLSWDGEAEKWK